MYVCSKVHYCCGYESQSNESTPMPEYSEPIYMCCSGAAVVLQWCCSGAAVVLQWCCSGAAVVLQWCCSGAAVVLQWCCNGQVQG